MWKHNWGLAKAVKRAKLEAEFLRRPIRACVTEKRGHVIGIPPNIINRKDRIFEMLPNPCRTVVEIGSQQGWFAYRLLKFTNAERIFCVDPWEGKTIDGEGGYNYTVWQKNLEPWIKQKRAIPIRLPSKNAAQDWESDQEIDFLFIDGDHRKAAVLLDLESWYPFVRSKGLVAGHDYTGVWGQDVQAALRVFLKGKKVQLKHDPIYNYSGNKDPCDSWWFHKP